jgi:hemoglobin/transferrin/lactoferrin receptor protein
VPDGARFTQGGAFAQSTFDLRPDRVRLLGALRFGGARYRARAADSPIVSGASLWPDDSLTVSSFTFRGAAVFTPDDRWTASLSLSRGFRAPHMTDLGTLGLTGAGFEVAAPDVAPLGGFIGSTADSGAISTAHAVSQLGPETSQQYEATAADRGKRWRTELAAFVNQISDNIQKQALILPPGAVGVSLGGQPVVSQTATGVVFVSAATTPVLVRANFDSARIWGIEHSFRASLSPSLVFQTSATYMRAVDTKTRLPPNIEGGTPAPDVFATLRWFAGGGWWVEPYAHAAARQTRLSTLDLGDRRVGAVRSRNSIRAFFTNGARARVWIGPGTDGTAGSADDVLIVTGETLAQIQDRVLGPAVTESSLFRAVPGYTTFGIRAGFRRGPHEVIVDAENLNDRNYRGMSWGVDAPGRGVSMKYVVRF